MAHTRDSGIVLSRRSTGEADDICTIYTRESGRERFIFRGLKKSVKRPRSGSEPGTMIDFLYYTSRGGAPHSISEFHIVGNNSGIRTDTNKIFSLYYMLELTDLTTGFTDPNPGIFNLLSAGIKTLSNTDYTIHFLLFFTIRYLTLQGVMPDIDTCHICGNLTGEGSCLDNDSFRICCNNCTFDRKTDVSVMGADFIKKCLVMKFDRIDCSIFSGESVLKSLKLITENINLYYGIRLKSISMLNIK